MQTYCVSVLDVNAAFLYADLPDGEPTITVSPPAVLKRLGFAGQNGIWVLKKALYGLRVSPKCWTKIRNDTVRGLKVPLRCGRTCVLQPADSQEHAWILVCSSGGILGYALFYVDDILLAASAVNLAAIRDKVKMIWKVKDQGTLLNPADKSYQDEAKEPLNVQSGPGFLGMRRVISAPTSEITWRNAGSGIFEDVTLCQWSKKESSQSLKTLNVKSTGCCFIKGNKRLELCCGLRKEVVLTFRHVWELWGPCLFVSHGKLHSCATKSGSTLLVLLSTNLFFEAKWSKLLSLNSVSVQMRASHQAVTKAGQVV